MRPIRKRVLALSVSFFAIAGVLAASEPPEAPDDVAQVLEEAAAPAATPPQMAAVQVSDPIPPAPPAQAQVQQLGPETNLPLPRFVSMKSDRARVRRGPSMTHRVDWEFLRRDMPVEVVAEYGHWRQIRDHDGVGGWVHYVLISGNRTVLIEDPMLDLRFQPSTEARVVARLEQGVIADLGKCDPDWCRLTVGGYRGWAPKSALWGVTPDEIRD